MLYNILLSLGQVWAMGHGGSGWVGPNDRVSMIIVAE